MSARLDTRWPSLLQERAEHIRNVRTVAQATRISVVARGLDELALIYGDAASSVEGPEGVGRAVPKPVGLDAKDDLIKRLELKASTFLREASSAPDKAEADQLRTLSAIFGGEARRLQKEAA